MKKYLVLVCLVCILALQISVLADTSSKPADMLKGKQDYIVLGSIKDIENDVITLTVDHELGKTSSDLVGEDIQISRFSYTYCEEHTSSDFRNPKVSDNIVVSLNYADNTYSMANCAYKVDSNEYATCKIVVLDSVYGQNCIKELLIATCFIRSNAMVNEFDFDSEGRIYAVYPQTEQQCVSVVDENGEEVITDEDADGTLPMTPDLTQKNTAVKTDNRNTYSIIILVAGSVFGAAIAYIINKKNSR